jgi:hypothetical protein
MRDAESGSSSLGPGNASMPIVNAAVHRIPDSPGTDGTRRMLNSAAFTEVALRRSRTQKIASR